MMNTVLAVGVGVAIFVLGQVLLRFFLEPMQEQRRIIGEIASALVYLANIHNLDRVTAGLQAAVSRGASGRVADSPPPRVQPACYA
jgi:hypothetical protein